jgi:O-antigen/teichoic acid export membrane protein
LIQISSFLLLGGALTSTAQAVFVGLERLAFSSVNLIVQSVVKAILMIILVVVGFGALGAVLGNIIALLVAGLTGLLLIWFVFKNFPQDSENGLNLFGNIKTMLRYGLPLSIGTIVNGFLLQFYNVILAIFASDALIGNYSIATTFVILITFFATPVTTVMFPAFSKLDAEKDKATLRSVFGFSVRYGSLLVVPVAMLVIVLSEPAVFTLFGNRYEFTPLYLSLLAVGHLFAATGNLSVIGLLNSQGQTRLTMKLILLTASIGFPLSYFMVSQLGVLGLILTTLIAGVPSLIVSRIWIWKHYDLTIDWVFGGKILFSSVVPAILTYFLIISLGLASWLLLVIGVLVFVPFFLVLVLVTRTIERSDIVNLKNMTESLGPIHKLFSFFMGIVERLMNVLRL